MASRVVRRHVSAVTTDCLFPDSAEKMLKTEACLFALRLKMFKINAR